MTFQKKLTAENMNDPIVCKKHGSVKPRVTRRGRYMHRRCPECYEALHKPAMKRWYEARRAYLTQKRRFERQDLKFRAMRAYGGKCACCGARDIEFLQIDHIADNGAEHRRATFGSRTSGCSHQMYRWLAKKNFPEGFQVLCANCNVAKSQNGVCPHQYGPRLVGEMET